MLPSKLYVDLDLAFAIGIVAGFVGKISRFIAVVKQSYLIRKRWTDSTQKNIANDLKVHVF